LIVGKKTARLAVDRNYMKRVMRDLFRTQQEQLPNIDLIVRVQMAFGHAKYDEIQQEFGQLLTRLPMLPPDSE
jgi:ribonuclease P protein component